MRLFISVIGIYFALVNLCGFVLMGIDKRRAERNIWRISEFTLFIPAIFGGAPGCLLGMYFFHHKTRHPKFFIGIPLILILQLGIVIWFFGFSPYRISFM